MCARLVADPLGSAADRNAIHLSWLLKLRWGALGSQTVTILAVDRLGLAPLPLGLLGVVVGLGGVSNAAFEIVRRRERDIKPRQLAAIMALDVLLLSAELYLTGGPINPFSFLYLVQIALAAVVLPPRWTWSLVVLSLAAYGTLFVDHLPLELAVGSLHEHLEVHLRGMWLGLGLAAVLIVYFLMRVTRALAARDAQLEGIRRLAERQERLASLATLAAGAAHELSTPLSTIALVARELERSFAAGAPRSGAEEDVALIRQEVERCRGILEQMAAHAGESSGEPIVRIAVGLLLGEVAAGLPATPEVRVQVEESSRTREVALPRRAVVQVVRGLIKNAQQAGGGVTVIGRLDSGRLVVDVRDAGPGMAPEVLARACEPFFTTKAPGQGMGLGLFLAQAVAERLGGNLVLSSQPGAGTRATLVLPADATGTLMGLIHEEAAHGQS